jgi:hypothetical protein
MRKTPAIIFGLALFAYALARVPDKFKPKWSQRLKSWQMLIGLLAVIMAVLIVMNPELYALGILGDSAFFDLLVLAISLQLQTTVSRVWHLVTAWLSKATRRMSMQICFELWCLVAFVSIFVSAVQKTVHRIFSLSRLHVGCDRKRA